MHTPSGFLFQIQNDGFLSDDAAAIHQSVLEHNWLAGEWTHENIIPEVFCKFEKLNKFSATAGVPVGSIEFVTKCLNIGYGIKELRRIYIPFPLQTDNFLGRRICFANSQSELAGLYKKWDVPSLFIKSASELKCDYADFYCECELPPEDICYFVSERMNILSEWRVFVFHGLIQDVKNYSGDPWLVPDKKTVETMIAAYTDAPGAYVIDVAVTDSMRTVVVEVHNFVCCGLYGFAGNALTSMIKAGFSYELNRDNSDPCPYLP